MVLLHESTIRTPEGVFEITVHVVKNDKRKRYTYRLPSEYLKNKFINLYRNGEKTAGKALAVLNKNKLMSEELKEARETVILTMNIYGVHSEFHKLAVNEYQRLKELEGFN